VESGARRGLLGAGVVVAALCAAGGVRADGGELPPWTEPSDVPLPDTVRSVIARRTEVAIYSAPTTLSARRGSAIEGARFSFFGSQRGSGCQGRWLLVGPVAWICQDVADPSPAEPALAPLPRADNGLPYRYFYAGKEGASGYFNLARAQDDAPDQELEPGWSVAIVEERVAHGERWGRTPHGKWFAMRELGPGNPFMFHGEELAGGKVDVAWIRSDRANVYSASKADKVTGTRVRFEMVRVREEKGAKDAAMIRVSDDGTPEQWIRARDLARPTAAPPPAEVGGEAATERWIDVELASQTLVAYEGKTPVFATLVSTGRGAPNSDLGTRLGVHRIWIKLLSTKMDNLEKEEATHFYYIEDVPWVQFFDKAIAIHGAYWHRDFGRVHSHGCVNLAPIDAQRMFFFTAPHMPKGWRAVIPAKPPSSTVAGAQPHAAPPVTVASGAIEQGAVVRVR